MTNISVIIPVYNGMKYLPETVQSVLEQTYQDFEIIIINDGSSDNIEEWFASLKKKHIKLISQENQGKSAARNAGILTAQGKYIAFLDADDLWKPTKLEKQLQCFNNSFDVGLVYTWTMIINENGLPIGKIITSQAKGDVWEKMLESNLLVCGSTPLIHRDCFDKVGLFSLDLPLAQDWDMWIRIANNYPFAVVQEPLVCYREHPENTSKKWQKMYQYNTLVLERGLSLRDQNDANFRNKAYRSLYLYLGWLALRSNNVQQGFYFLKKAINSSLTIETIPSFFRLGISLLIMFSLGHDNFHRLLLFNRRLRQITKNLNN
ncbi:MAG: glycosyltransferase [Crocosphaera sp.]|nr:glycosyltransferase [Crocosphaera sp.]